MSFKAPIFTNKGKQLYASCLAGKNEIIFTNIKLGDGELMAQAIADLEDLVNPIKTIVLNDKKLIGNDQVLIRAVFKNIDIASGFYWREVGLYAQDPENPEDRSKDILFCYQNAGDTAEYIPSASSGLIDKILSMSLVVSDVNSVNVSFFSESYALKEDLDEQIALQAQSLENHKTDPNAHKNIFNNFAKSVNSFAVTENNNIELSEIRNSYAEDNQKYSSVLGGEAYGKGAGLFAYGAKHAEYPGYFYLYAMTSEGEKSELVGKPNGSLTWQGHNIATTNGIKMQGHILKDTDDSELIIGGATVFNNGAYGAFRGVNFGVAEEAGSFAFKAQGDKQYFLKGTKDGSLKWNDKNLVRSVNGVSADNAGNVNVTLSGYKLVYWETDWFDIAYNGLYSFSLQGTPFENVSKESISVKVIGKVKTAQNGFSVGDYIYPDYSNYIGATGNEEIGSTPYISGNTLSIKFGNTNNFVTCTPTGAINNILKSNVKVKITLTAWIKE